jgi:hypothetical protein
MDLPFGEIFLTGALLERFTAKWKRFRILAGRAGTDSSAGRSGRSGGPLDSARDWYRLGLYGSGAMKRALLLLLVLLWPAQALPAPERRVALVIGNGAYTHASALPNPANDARDVGAALGRLGFDVHLGMDLDQAGMQEVVIRFARDARGADVAMFYYAGHAMQFEGVNYLLPVDARLTDETDLRRMTRVDELVRDLQTARNLRILVLDACRDNPLAEGLLGTLGATRGATSMAPGLARIDSREGLVISFATQPGRTADDGIERNSPYTRAFLDHIESRSEIGSVFRRISADVHAATGGRQWPELSLSLIDEFYLAGRPDEGAPAGPDGSAEAWAQIGESDDRDVLQAFVAQYPDGVYAALARKRLRELNGGPPPSEIRSPATGRYPFAALLTSQSELMSQPNALAGSLRRLAVGETLEVVAESEAAMWYRVRDRQGNEGFVRKDRLRQMD